MAARKSSRPYRGVSTASVKAEGKRLLAAGHPSFVKRAQAQRAKRAQQGKDLGFYALVGIAAVGALYLAHKSKTAV